MATKTRRKKQVTPERLQELGFAYAPPLIIAAAVNNKVFDSLESGPKTIEQVSKETGASRRGLRAIMNALIGLRLLKKDRQNKYSLTPESAAFLVSNKPGSLTGLFGTIVPHLASKWLPLTDIVRNGQPLDLAAGSGIWGIALTQKSPRVRVIALDWAGMIPTTKRFTQKFGVADRFNYVEGDLLEANFGNGYDLAILGHILHSEGEERSRPLLKKTFRALKVGGTIAIAEWLVNDERTEPVHSLMFAVQMLVNTEKGDTFSFNEIKSWLEDAGFKKVRKLQAPGPSPLVLATKP